jgi:hypothetical protein
VLGCDCAISCKMQYRRQRDENEVVTMSEGRSAGFTAGSVPEAYDRFMAPQLFEPWARELVGRAKLRSGSSVLDGPGRRRQPRSLV